MADYIQIVGQRIKRRREDLGFSQVDLFQRSGVSQRTISQVENAEVATNLDVLCRLSKALGWTPEQLLGGAEHDVWECHRRVGDGLKRIQSVTGKGEKPV